nr:MAG: RNA-dependent RNA polymerase [Narnaviridae sp. 2]
MGAMAEPLRGFSLPKNPWSWPVTPMEEVGYLSRCPADSLLDVEFCERVWTTVRSCYLACCPSGKVSDLRSSIRFARWLVDKVLSGEKHVVCKEIKLLAHSFRLWAIDGKWPSCKSSLPDSFIRQLKGVCPYSERRAQMARLSRSLPFGDQKVIDEAIRSYKKIVSTPSKDVNLEVADRIYEWSKNYIKERSIRHNVSWAPNENSASLNFSRADGGRLAELISDASEVLEPLLEFVPLTEGSPLLDEVIVETAIENCRTKTITGKVVAVTEKGYKARVLCEFPAFALLPGDIIRRQIWHLLEEEDWMDTDRVSNEKKLNDFFKHCLNQSGSCLSADLSNATDYIPHIYAQALWAGIVDGLNVDPWVKDYIVKMFSPMDLLFPDGSVVKTERGIHMGTPLSFLTLCLLHRFAVEVSGHRRYPHIIRGDDLIGIFDNPSIYLDVMRVLGFKINPSKTISSKYGGVFVERTFVFDRHEEVLPWHDRHSLWSKIHDKFPHRHIISSVKVLNDFPLAGLLNPSVDYRGSFLRHMGRWYAQIHERLTSRQRKNLSKIIHACGFSRIELAKKFRIPLSTPLELGGCGIPNRHGRLDIDAPFWMRQVIGCAASDIKAARKFTNNISKLDGGEYGIFYRLYTEQLEQNPQYAFSTFVFSPAETEHFQSAKRRFKMYRLLGGGAKNIKARAKRESVFNSPVPLSRWYRPFNKLEKVRPRWAVSRRANSSLLIDRIRSFNGLYVPTHLIRETRYSLVSQDRGGHRDIHDRFRNT